MKRKTSQSQVGFIVVSFFTISFVLSGCEALFEETIDIPDENFMNALKRDGVTRNLVLTVEEAEAVTNLDIRPDYDVIDSLPVYDTTTCINNLDGIAYFINLKTLDCSYNQLTELNVSSNTALRTLWCFNSEIVSLNVSNNTALVDLRCYYNQLTSLDFSNNTAIETLWCGSNELTSLNVTNNTSLTSLVCSSNQLSSLDVSNNTKLDRLVIENMPSLHEVCVWIDHGFSLYAAYGSPNAYLTTDCNSQ